MIGSSKYIPSCLEMEVIDCKPPHDNVLKSSTSCPKESILRVESGRDTPVIVSIKRNWFLRLIEARWYREIFPFRPCSTG